MAGEAIFWRVLNKLLQLRIPWKQYIACYETLVMLCGFKI